MLLMRQVPFMPTQRIDGNGVIPGYRGHVPNVVNTIGMSTFLSGPGFTEVKVEEMEKMGGLGDLGDSAAAYVPLGRRTRDRCRASTLSRTPTPFDQPLENWNVSSVETLACTHPAAPRSPRALPAAPWPASPHPRH